MIDYVGNVTYESKKKKNRRLSEQPFKKLQYYPQLATAK